ncbi:AAA domain protein [Orientia tsutsugamushi str. UT76]|nr:AAA domain protein [Orientia tsutsugamushi str. UT76]
MKGSLIVVDEAGMVGTKAYAELFRVVRNNYCQLILAGDEKQLASIERGGMFEC